MWRCILLGFLVTAYNLGAPESPSDRIIGGDNATITDYPYALQLEYYELVCGAVLVALSWALTAANCLHDRDLDVFIIRAGTTDRASGGETFYITEVIYHPQYNWDHNEYNAALLHLNSSVTSSNTRIVEMVDAESEIPVGSNITVLGWGWINEEYYDENFPDTVQIIQLPVLDVETCNTTESQFNVYSDTMFCAGYLKGGEGFCYADNGGPAMYEGLLIGLASWTDNCARARRPGVFTKISYVRTWIDSIIST